MKAKVARKIGSQKRPGIRVLPRDDDMRRLLKSSSGVRFRSEGSMEWPDDQFTRKRIRDGDVTVEETKQQQPKAHHGRAQQD
jgi:hypothetical protein